LSEVGLKSGDIAEISRNVQKEPTIDAAKVHHFLRIEANLKRNPANIQEFLTFSAKKWYIANKSCRIAGFCKYGNKNKKNDVFLHHYWIHR